MRHTHNCTIELNYETVCILLSNFTTNVIFHIFKSKAKIFKFGVDLLLIRRNDFFRANMNNFPFYSEHAKEE
jgi:hypothetical protein